jgi:hypothetical protein
MKLIRRSICLFVLVTSAPTLAENAPTARNTSTRLAELQRPMRWLLDAQNADGGWGAESKTAPDVATTAVTVIALLRHGHTLSSGAHRDATRRGVEFIVRSVERVPKDELALQREGTQPQAKLGRYIDTFLAAQALGEVLPSAKNPEERARLHGVLDKVVQKVQALQRRDGSFEGQGWAPVLSSAFANGGLYAARQAGSSAVRADALASSDRYMKSQYDERSQKFRTEAGAGVALYSAASTLGAAAREGKVHEAPAQAARQLMKDESFVRGFGTYGGEEHVSYMMTSEALAKVGGEEWRAWDASIRTRLASIQREDGTWRGDHCITSTTFCTAASLITLAIQTGNSVGSSKDTPRGVGLR